MPVQPKFMVWRHETDKSDAPTSVRMVFVALAIQMYVHTLEYNQPPVCHTQ